jgi:hypothetical protein
MSSNASSDGVGVQENPSIEEKFWLWIAGEAAKIQSDGCSKAKDWNLKCCWLHDLECHYKRDAQEAFKAYLVGVPAYWQAARPKSRRDADKTFTGCNLKNSKGILDKSRSLIRYIGVRLGALWPF